MKGLFNNLSTRAKLIVSFAILWALLATVIVIAYVNITNLVEAEQKLHDVNYEIAVQLTALRADLNHNRAETLGMMLTSDRQEQESIKQAIESRSQGMDASLARLLPLDPHPEHQTQLRELQSLLAEYRQVRGQTIALILAEKLEEAMELSAGAGAENYESIRQFTYSMNNEAMDEVDAQVARDQQSAQSATRLFVAFGSVALVLGAGMVILLNQTIARPLDGMANAAGQVAAGDLSIELPAVQRQDEVGRLAQAFRQMVENLRRSTGDTSEAVGMLSSSASEILAATTQMAAGTAETASAISETTTTVEEVRQAAQLSSQKAQNVSDSAQRVAQISQSGQEAVEAAAEGMDRIRRHMDTIADTVVRLSEQSQSIGGIIASVTDIADQSNLLAVNAAIEAARAGDQGKGFAVVAQEIRSLAEQSKQATAEVRSILSDVQKATSNAVMATEQGSKAVEAGSKEAAQAGEAIRLLAGTSVDAVQAATQIVASSQQQVVGMDQIGLAMENIDQAGTQNASSMKQMEIAAQNLHELGQRLKELVSQFTV